MLSGHLPRRLNRCLQLIYFNTNFIIVGPNEYKNKFDAINTEPYIRFGNKFEYKDYNPLIDFYDYSVKIDDVRKGFFRGI